MHSAEIGQDGVAAVVGSSANGGEGMGRETADQPQGGLGLRLDQVHQTASKTSIRVA